MDLMWVKTKRKKQSSKRNRHYLESRREMVESARNAVIGNPG